MNLLYTTSEPKPNLNGDKDIKTHEKKVEAGRIGLVSPNGSVCRMCDFSPSNDPQMHRTQSLDYGVVMEGEMELILDSGEVHLMTKGDVAVQRGQCMPGEIPVRRNGPGCCLSCWIASR